MRTTRPHEGWTEGLTLASQGRSTMPSASAIQYWPLAESPQKRLDAGQQTRRIQDTALGFFRQRRVELGNKGGIV